MMSLIRQGDLWAATALMNARHTATGKAVLNLEQVIYYILTNPLIQNRMERALFEHENF